MKLPNCQYVEIETGRVVTRGEMFSILENEYDFDDFTPLSELWNYFDTLESYEKNKENY